MMPFEPNTCTAKRVGLPAMPLRLAKNPVLVFDFGEISENSVAFSPETLHVAASGADTTFTGRKVQGWDVLDTERDDLPEGTALRADAVTGYRAFGRSVVIASRTTAATSSGVPARPRAFRWP